MTYSILVVGPAWIGDMVMAQSLFKVLKARHPNARIDVLAPEWTFSLLKCMPEVNEAIVMPLKHGELNLAARYRLGVGLRQRCYDQAIVLQNSFKSAFIPYFAKIPKRTGWLGECRYGLLNDYRRLNDEMYPRMVDQFAALGMAGDEPRMQVPPYPHFEIASSDRDAVLAACHVTLTQQPILALGVGAAFGPSKRWPIHYFASLAKQALSDGWEVWLFGSDQDRALTEVVMQHTDGQCMDFSGRTSLDQTLALLSCVTGVVTNDSGLMHMAAALNKSLVALYGSTSPSFTPPLSEKAIILKRDLPCQPCFKRECPLQHHRCMNELYPDLVLAAIRQWGHS